MVTERALREIYLMPFQLAIKNARPGALMTSYNKVNRLHASEDPGLLDHIIRKEWGYEGLIMSDWFVDFTNPTSILFGLALILERPGLVPTASRVQSMQGLISKCLGQRDFAAQH